MKLKLILIIMCCYFTSALGKTYVVSHHIDTILSYIKENSTTNFQKIYEELKKLDKITGEPLSQTFIETLEKKLKETKLNITTSQLYKGLLEKRSKNSGYLQTCVAPLIQQSIQKSLNKFKSIIITTVGDVTGPENSTDQETLTLAAPLM